jgi:hypothetical protein
VTYRGKPLREPLSILWDKRRPLPRYARTFCEMWTETYVAEPSPAGAILRPMKVEEIAEVVAKLPPDQLARFRRWFTAFEAGRTDHAEELDTTATKLGRLAGHAFAELKKRAKEP